MLRSRRYISFRESDHAERRQIAVCACLAAAYWIAAVLGIRLAPATLASGWTGDLGFVASIPVCWLSVWLVIRLAWLEPDRILAGCLIVLGTAMLLDGVALRWFHDLYGSDDTTLRLGAAWLLWGYGLSAWIAVGIAARARRPPPGTIVDAPMRDSAADAVDSRPRTRASGAPVAIEVMS